MIAKYRDRIEKKIMRRMLDLPKPLARKVFGKPPRNDRGEELELQTHIFMKLIEISGQSDLTALGVDGARKLYATTHKATDVKPAKLPSVVDLEIPGPVGDLPVRVYRPGTGTRAAIIFFHGGGFVLGDIASYEGLCSNMAKWSDCVVISVEYRLAPEHPFPAGVEDSISAVRWILGHADVFDIDPERVAVSGDSAGANLATVTCHATAQDELRPALQVLFYPTTDYQPGYPSIELFSDGFFLTAKNMVWFSQMYVDGQEAADARIAPILQDDLSNQPPCILVTTGFDPLRDEGEAYGRKLEEAGVDVEHINAAGLVHGFANTGGIIEEAARVTEEVCRKTGERLAAEVRGNSHN